VASRRQLTPPRFDKPAFSRFSQNCEPLIVVEIFGKIVKRQVCVCVKNGVSCRQLRVAIFLLDNDKLQILSEDIEVGVFFKGNLEGRSRMYPIH